MEKIVHLFFSGAVQGVGFRFTARILARKHKINGWVKNLADGRVELVANGANKNIGEFLNDLREQFKGYILNQDIEEILSKENYRDFQILF